MNETGLTALHPDARDAPGAFGHRANHLQLG